jgi:surface protein
MRAPQTHARAALMWVRMCVRVWVRVWAHPQPCEPFPSAWTACGVGAQAFIYASAFNADIGAWNTASVTTLSEACAAFRPGGTPPQVSRTRSARASMRRGRAARPFGGSDHRCVRASQTRACVRYRCALECAHVRARHVRQCDALELMEHAHMVLIDTINA